MKAKDIILSVQEGLLQPGQQVTLVGGLYPAGDEGAPSIQIADGTPAKILAVRRGFASPYKTIIKHPNGIYRLWLSPENFRV